MEKKWKMKNWNEMELELMANYKGSFTTINVFHQLATNSCFNDWKKFNHQNAPNSIWVLD